MRRCSSTMALLGLARTALSHEQRQATVVNKNADWMSKHMAGTTFLPLPSPRQMGPPTDQYAEEHHVDGFDANSFFQLHDYNSDGAWDPDEILRTYGLMDESNANVGPERRREITAKVLELVDGNGDGRVTRDEFLLFVADGKTLPDMDSGPGHHGDDEYEYEIHHWEKYHDESTTLEDLTHPEDIEHFRKHEMLEEAEERQERLDRQAIVEENIPSKFFRVQA